MPPRSFLEVVGEPIVHATEHGPVVEIPMKLNSNLQSPVLEKLEESRKTMVVSSLEHIRKEVNRDLDAALQTDEVKERSKADIFWKYDDELGGKAFIASIKEEIVKVLEAARARSAAWYNDDRNNRQANQEAMDVQRMAIGKLRLWIEDRSLYVQVLNKLSALDCDRKAAGRLLRLLEEAAEPRDGEEEEGAVRSRKQGA
eukprot:618300-Rhodomonas_salina.1